MNIPYNPIAPYMIFFKILNHAHSPFGFIADTKTAGRFWERATEPLWKG
ncbi:hypothetical protein Atep_31410 (plasmid) [Allochromatium tepidum]|uniref:Uncharacterized protein n=1 Tax=Allochromatium tepidum TaxID=553982 RepID=A0ABN6GFP0_9GAMM|nr:hypothetical protein Atep_31410 [Allochromatium tepidum]